MPQQLDPVTRRDSLEEPETLLWRAVVARIMSDAMYGLPMSLDILRSAKSQKQRRVTVHQRLDAEEARMFLFTDTKDYFTVCAGAGFDPQSLRDKARRALRAFDQAFLIVNPPQGVGSGNGRRWDVKVKEPLPVIHELPLAAPYETPPQLDVAV